MLGAEQTVQRRLPHRIVAPRVRSFGLSMYRFIGSATSANQPGLMGAMRPPGGRGSWLVRGAPNHRSAGHICGRSGTDLCSHSRLPTPT